MCILLKVETYCSEELAPCILSAFSYQMAGIVVIRLYLRRGIFLRCAPVMHGYQLNYTYLVRASSNLSLLVCAGLETGRAEIYNIRFFIFHFYVIAADKINNTEAENSASAISVIFKRKLCCEYILKFEPGTPSYF